MSNWPAIIACIVGAISILGTVVTMTAVIIQMRSNLGTLTERDRAREAKEVEIDKKVVDLLMSFKEFVAVQSQLNITIKGFMEAQTDINEKLLSEVAAMVKASAEGSQIISLLTEVLRQKKVIASE